MIVAISNRGQITVPKKLRSRFSTYAVCEETSEGVILKPLKTSDQFLLELEESYEDWKQNGGTSLDQLAKENGLTL